MQFDFIEHQLEIRTCEGLSKHIELGPKSVADFYAEVMESLRSLGIDVKIQASPDEVANPIPFADDRTHASYDPEFAQRFWASWFRWIACSRNFAAGSSESAVQCISSGEVSIWLSRAFPGAGRRTAREPIS